MSEGVPSTCILRDWLHLNNRIYGHLEDGRFVATTELRSDVEHVLKEGGRATTQNTIYILGRQFGGGKES
ncbi:hypothetical protein HOR51_gp24 [Ralstonia phage phiAp1]|uniref:Uncharacterized protein n=1 Tax=Ralstonia phage phiAp1 TaxID=2783867 RepID=A0A1L7DS96_9CAUD|nr:hypothetical protein HOR51_gp24 [Ralstonia phage phiAp1]APU03165.1 hypothetical protein phiAp1_24 [Ralstonia phage phiAp1]